MKNQPVYLACQLLLKRTAILGIMTTLYACNSIATTSSTPHASSLVNQKNSASNNILDTTLANGLRVIIKPDHRAPVVMTQIWYQVGSSDENASQTGLSHALEHMMFKGTTTVPGEEFARINAKFGGSNNAFTNQHETAYYQMYPANRLALALELEADRMQNLQLKADDFNKEIQVVMEERRQRTDDNPKALAYERFRLLAYPTSPLRYPVIGHMASLQALNLTALADWYKTWYAPNNAILVIVGDVEPQTALAQVTQYFSPIAAKPLPKRATVDEYIHYGERNLNLFMPVKVPVLFLAWNVPSLKTATNPDDAYALALIANVLDGGLSARFETRLIRDQRLATAISSGYDLFARGGELFTINAIPDHGKNLAQVRAGIFAEIEKLKTETISTDELERIRTNYLAELIYNQDSIQGQSMLLGGIASSGLDYRLVDSLPNKIKQITPEQLRDVASRYLTLDNLSTLFLAPEKTTAKPIEKIAEGRTENISTKVNNATQPTPAAAQQVPLTSSAQTGVTP